MSTITIDVDSEIVTQAQAIIEKLGLDMATAIRLFLNQTVNHRGISFTLPSDEPREVPPVLPRKTPKYTEDQIRAMQEYEARTGKKAVRPPPQLGCLKGMIHMSDDFDEPLEDFKEYME